MWVCLSDSFLSIVDKDDPSGDTLLVRARRGGDIGRVFPGAEVERTPGRDYRYRARIARDEVAAAIAGAVRGIRYGNFKASVADPDRHHAYVRMWDAMARFQSTEPTRGARRALPR